MTSATADRAHDLASTNGNGRPAPPAARIEMLSLEQLTLPEDNPRRKVGDVSELAASIESVGLLEPIVATPRDGGYLVVCGSRRYTAATQLKLAEVPVIVRELDERERREAMLIENLQREDLSVLEEADAFQALVDMGFSQRDLASRLGRSQSHLSKRIALLKLPTQARKELDSGGITLQDAQELLKLADMPKRMEQAWADGRRGGLGHYVATQLREHEKAKAIGSETERLKKAGVRLISPPKNSYGELRLPKNAVEISKTGSYNALKLDPDKHASEPCHAAVVVQTYQGVRVMYVCTDRKRHPRLKTDQERYSGQTAATQAKDREKQRAQREAAKQRTEFLRALIAGPPRRSAGAPLAHLVEGFLEISQQDVLKVACELLGLEVKQTKTSYGATVRDYKGPIGKHAEASSSNLQRVALALGLAATEARMEQQWLSWGARERAHFDFLAAEGYELSAAERQRLPRQRKAKTEAAT